MHLIGKTKSGTVLGVIGLGAMTSRLAATADDSGDRSGSEIAQLGKLDDQEGALPFEFRGGCDRGILSVRSLYVQKRATKKENRQIVILRSRTQ